MHAYTHTHMHMHKYVALCYLYIYMNTCMHCDYIRIHVYRYIRMYIQADIGTCILQWRYLCLRQVKHSLNDMFP